MGNTKSSAKKCYIDQNYKQNDGLSPSQHKLSHRGSTRRRSSRSKSEHHNHPKKKMLRTTNPFLIFFLQMQSKHPTYHVTRIAAIAGKKWAELTPDRKQKYIDLANEEKKRRGQVVRKKKRKSLVNVK